MNARFSIASARDASVAMAGLPRTNSDEGCSALLQMLSDLEARALPLRTLLEIVEVFRPSGDEVIAGYRSGYTDRALPLGENEARRFRHAMALLGAFEGLYRRAFEKALGAAPRDAARKDLAAALQRSLACVADQMIEHYRARQTVGVALWNRLQQGMQAAWREKLDAVEVADSLHPRGTATPLATYGRALLLSIAQAGAMTHRSLEATLALTALFEHLVESAMLDSKDGGRTEPQEGMAGVGIQRTGRVRVVAIGGVTHLVNTTKIDGALNSCIQRLAEGGTPEEIGLAAVAQADLAGLLPRLRRIWCGAGEIREAARQPVHEQSAVAIGFQEIYQFACPGPMNMPQEFRMYTGSKVPTRVQTEQMPASTPNANPVENWQTLDHSVSGMRAQRPQAGAQLRRGQLLAVDLNGMREVFGISLAEVRWLQQFTESDAGGIAAGVRFVSANAQVALARVIGLLPDQYQTVGPVFVLDESELVLPSGWFAAGRTVDLWHKEQVSPVRLTSLRARGADYEIAGFEPFHPHESDMSLDFTSPAVRWPYHPVPS